MNPTRARLSVEISRKEHKKLKIFADANGLTLRELILISLDPILHPKKEPNKSTLKTIKDTEKGIGLKTYENVDQMWEALGLNE